MKLSDVAEVLGAKLLCCHDKASMEISIVCASDLMSDVLAFSVPGALLVTGLTNAQSINTADVADVAAVAYVRGKQPEDGVVELAQAKGIPVLTCDLSLFEACGRMFEKGLVAGCSIKEPQ